LDSTTTEGVSDFHLESEAPHNTSVEPMKGRIEIEQGDSTHGTLLLPICFHSA